MDFNINTIAVWVAKFAIGFLYLFEYMRYNRAKRMDSTIAFKLNKRSWIETAVVLILNISLFVYPMTSTNTPILTFASLAMLVITYFHTRRFIMLGKKVVFLLEHPFLVKDLSKVTYEKGMMKFLIKNQAFKIRLPLGDMDTIMNRLSGKYFKKGS